MKFLSSILVRALSAASVALVLTGVCAGQAASPRESGLAPSRFDLYAGYMYVKPIHNSGIGPHKYEDIGGGGIVSASYFFDKYFGVQLEGAFSPSASDDTHCWNSGQGGLVGRFQYRRFVPFAHALVGGTQVGGPALQPCSSVGLSYTGGVGVDYILPLLNNHLAVRPAMVDYTYINIDNGAPYGADNVGGIGFIYALRFSAGLTLRLGHQGQSAGKEGMTLGCSVDPGEAFPGAILTATAGAENLKDGRDLHYLWTTSGGALKGTEATEPLDTTGLAPGTYNVGVRMVRGGGDRTLASCTTSFVVVNPTPPTISCSADKAAINSGTPVTITTVAQSASGRPLTYSYSSTNGQVTGDGATAQLSTIGSTPGAITVTCKVIDDKGLTAQATASVVVATPALPEVVVAANNKLCTLSFVRDTRRPNRVDNEAKGCLDDIALTLNRDPATKLVLVGSHGERERPSNAAERVLNAADYLTKEKGIDRSRLDLRTTGTAGQQVTTTLLAPGATFTGGTGDQIDATKVRRSGQPYGMPGQRTVKSRRKVRRHRATALPSL